jgi:hypothetical protein
LDFFGVLLGVPRGGIEEGGAVCVSPGLLGEFYVSMGGVLWVLLMRYKGI